jgi:hypothetical protein
VSTGDGMRASGRLDGKVATAVQIRRRRDGINPTFDAAGAQRSPLRVTPIGAAHALRLVPTPSIRVDGEVATDLTRV